MFYFKRPFIDLAQTHFSEKLFSNEEIQEIEKNLSFLTFEKGDVNKDKVPFELENSRRSNVKWITHTPEWFWVYQKLHDEILKANSNIWNFDLHSINENIQYTEYDSQELGHFGWHMDIGSHHASLRKLSLTVQLSDPSEYEGGDLEFMVSDLILKSPKTKGLCTIFPSYLMHRVTPVTKGTRKSLVLWVGGTPFR